MLVHANAKLGLAGRLALVLQDRGGSLAESCRGRLRCFAGDGAPLVASLDRGRAPPGVVVGSLEPTETLAATAGA